MNSKWNIKFLHNSTLDIYNIFLIIEAPQKLLIYYHIGVLHILKFSHWDEFSVEAIRKSGKDFGMISIAVSILTKSCVSLEAFCSQSMYLPNPFHHKPVMLELWGMWSIPSLPLLPGPLWPGMVAPDRALSMG